MGITLELCPSTQCVSQPGMRLRHTLRIQALLQLLPAFDFENLAYAFAFEKSVVMDVPVVDSNIAEYKVPFRNC